MGRRRARRPAIGLFAFCALVGFAANSLLCRTALLPHHIDASTFTLIRVSTGALTLAVLLAARGEPLAGAWRQGSWGSAYALFVYAAAFSFAYLRLSVATGALLLFGTVQVTMIAAGVRRGEKLRRREIAGFCAASAGLVVLLLPGLAAPDPLGAVLMLVAGLAWGVYSLRGRRADRPLSSTAGNFARSVPLALLVSLLALPFGAPHASAQGLALAAASGSLASGIGYTFWYAALPALSASRAAIVQLAAPLLAAAGGVLLLHEELTTRLGIATALIIGGIALVMLVKKRSGSRTKERRGPRVASSQSPTGT